MNTARTAKPASRTAAQALAENLTGARAELARITAVLDGMEANKAPDWGDVGDAAHARATLADLAINLLGEDE